jgi:XRE family transcriptional regulator, regulator of sulfur utilization
MHEAGSRETAIVEAGPVRFICGAATHDLDGGDSVTFDADLPHHFENPGEGEARFYAVVAAGLRRS